MLGTIRRYAVVSTRHGFKLVAGLLLLIWATTLFAPCLAAADETCDELSEFVKRDGHAAPLAGQWGSLGKGAAYELRSERAQ